MISQYTGNPSAPYVTKKAAVGLLSGGGYFTVGDFTLAANTTSTIVPLTGCVPTSSFSGVPWPQTLHAANAIDTTYYTMGTDEITINHASNSLTDRKFGFVLFY